MQKLSLNTEVNVFGISISDSKYRIHGLGGRFRDWGLGFESSLASMNGSMKSDDSSSIEETRSNPELQTDPKLGVSVPEPELKTRMPSGVGVTVCLGGAHVSWSSGPPNVDNASAWD